MNSVPLNSQPALNLEYLYMHKKCDDWVWVGDNSGSIRTPQILTLFGSAMTISYYCNQIYPSTNEYYI
jgi:hypothetical protein